MTLHSATCQPMCIVKSLDNLSISTAPTNYSILKIVVQARIKYAMGYLEFWHKFTANNKVSLAMPMFIFLT